MAKNNGSQNFSSGLGLHARRVIANIVLILLSVLCLIWFWILLINASRDNSDLQTGAFKILPSNYLFKNLKAVVTGADPFVKALRNSTIIAISAAALSTYFSAMTAYAIHAYNFKAKKAIYTFILAIMMIPSQVTALGFLRLVNKIGLYDSWLPLIIPAIAAPSTFFYMKQYMDSVLPMSIIEAARIDGSGEFRTFNTIILPIMKPAIAVQAIFTFVASWNNFFTPALILDKAEKKTLPLMISILRSSDFKNFDQGKVYASIAFAIFPVIVVYFALSKFIVGGVAAGSVKG